MTQELPETAAVAPAELHAACVAALLAAPGERGLASAGVSAGDVVSAADWLTHAELLGMPGFGIEMLLRDLERLPDLPAQDRDKHPAQDRGSDAASGITAITAFDATGIPGPLALATAVRRAAESMAAHGIGVVGVRNVGALGVLGFAARALAERGAVALVAAQAPAFVAPWGGNRPAIGTNPLSVAAPRQGAAPLVADFATSPLTLAELRSRRAAGEAIPNGLAVDADGAPTTDASRVAAILPESLVGSLGGLLVELIAGVAVGGRGPAGAPAVGRGALILAIDPAAAGGGDVALDTAQLAADWRAAGGHVPARFDALPPSVTAVTEPINVSAASLAALRALAGEAAA